MRILLLFLTLTVVLLAQPLDPGPELVRPVVRHPILDKVFYFVLPDRFANGDPGNDRGGLEGGPLDHGFLPTHKEYYHGGDLAGLQSRLDYLEELGINALWLTPIMVNRPVQGDGTIEGSIAGYHGYWILDFENPDPHLGTAEELKGLIEAAHRRGLSVYFDMVCNHTADVIRSGQSHPYVSREQQAYRDLQGQPFDERDFAHGPSFPELGRDSFPVEPDQPDTIKSPSWLNRPELYHNRGDWDEGEGESSQYGDFYGLDDLFTEHPEVVTGFTRIFERLIEKYDVDGFRVDTVRHVNVEFWQQVVPRVLDYAQRLGKTDFFLFGEVYDPDPNHLSFYTREGKYPGLLDFGLQAAVQAFAVEGAPPSRLEEFFAQDDRYIDPDSNAHLMGGFVSNHDLGRLGGFLSRRPESERLARARLAHALVFFARGFPIIYYGDEQGFVSEGQHADARGDMFASRTPEYVRRNLIGTDKTMAEENFDRAHPLYESLALFSRLYRGHRALRRGAQIYRSSQSVYAFSRVDREDQVEYLLAFNNSSRPQEVRLPVLSPSTVFQSLVGENDQPHSDASGFLEVEVGPLDFVILRADRAIPARPLPTVELVQVEDRLVARLDQEDRFVEVTFAVDGQILGTDDNPPYQVFLPAAAGRGRFQAVVNDLRGGLVLVEKEEA